MGGAARGLRRRPAGMEADGYMTTSTVAREHTFYSRSANLRMIRRPHLEEPVSPGVFRKLQDEVVVEFAPDGQVTVRDGEGVMLNAQGVEQDVVQWLRSQREYNVLVFEMGNEPDALRPSEGEFLDRVIDAVGALDADAVRELVDEERSTHNRVSLIERAARALEMIGAQETSLHPDRPVRRG